MPEPTGVVPWIRFARMSRPSGASVRLLAPVILAGNTAVGPRSTKSSVTRRRSPFSEIIATSDLPGGVVNILAGDRAELAPHFASHMDVNAIVDASGDEKIGREFVTRRFVQHEAIYPARYGHERMAESRSRKPASILDTVEMKTAWHPIGL